MKSYTEMVVEKEDWDYREPNYALIGFMMLLSPILAPMHYIVVGSLHLIGKYVYEKHRGESDE